MSDTKYLLQKPSGVSTAPTACSESFIIFRKKKENSFSFLCVCPDHDRFSLSLHILFFSLLSGFLTTSRVEKINTRFFLLHSFFFLGHNELWVPSVRLFHILLLLLSKQPASQARAYKQVRQIVITKSL